MPVDLDRMVLPKLEKVKLLILIKLISSQATKVI